MNIVNNILNLTLLILSIFIFLFRILFYLQVLQILEYFNIKYLRHILIRKKQEYIFDDAFLIISIILVSINLFLKFNIFYLKIILAFLLCLSLFYNIKLYKKRKKFSKKGLNFTKRLIRIFSLNLIFFFIISTFLFIYKLDTIIVYFIFITPFTLALLNSIILPLEIIINNRYFNHAIKIIKEYKPFIIGVTGSYGKTSTKYFIYELIKDKFRAVMTPESYNTAMGITKFIRENLKKETEIFIVEIAENEVGGFKRLLKLINPNILIITSVGIQHLEEFGSKEKILNEFKYLIEHCIKKDECKNLILNKDDEFLNQFNNEKIIKISINSNNYPFIEILDESLFGTKFKIKIFEKETIFETKLIGKETIRNLLIAIEVSLILKISIDEVKEKVKILEPFKHRLNVLRKGKVVVVDDAYNSNPIGAKMALDLISKYKEGRRIIITPGFIELGKKEYEENKNFGKYMKDKVDYVFLVGGKRTKPILEGLNEVNFPKEKIFVFKNFFEANDYLKTFLNSYDLILFENDLPEIYEEI